MTFKGCPRCDTDRASEYIRERTVALFWKCPEDGKIHVAGTGVLFDIAGVKFLFCAHHVFELHKRSQIQISALDASEAILLFGVASPVAHLRADEFDPSKDFDIAAVRLSHPVIEYLAQHGKRFMNRTGVGDVDHYNDISHAAVCGFPDARLDLARELVNSLTFSSLLFRPEPGHGRSFDGTIHVGMTYKTVPNHNIGEDGKPLADSPYPGGMSGCGMWMIHDKPFKGFTWSTDQIKLVGIQHKWIGKSVLVGTRIEFLLGGLKKKFPELRAALDLGILVDR